MAAEIPKQYLRLRGRPIIEHTLSRLCGHPRIGAVVVALATDDRWWGEVTIESDVPVLRVDGGTERCHSVVNGLMALKERAQPRDWVLVHDAVRPCVRPADIERLMSTLADHPVGGLLGLRVRDTMKRADSNGTVQETVSRDGLWHALTPQMFRLSRLAEALDVCIQKGVLVTDEAQAIELAGGSPRMVEGHEDNIKITRPQDMALAELFIASQEAVE